MNKEELSLREALEESIKIWEKLAETGAKNKRSVPGAERFCCGCPLCTYQIQEDELGWIENCAYCPIGRGVRARCEHDPSHPYCQWRNSVTVAGRVYAAEAFVAELRGYLAALPEEWVDVTPECNISLVNREQVYGYEGYKIQLHYKGKIVLELGCVFKPWGNSEYRVEQYPDRGSTGFKVLKKQ